MLVNVRFSKIIKILFIYLFFLLFSGNLNAYAKNKDQVINKLNKTNSIKFAFKQKSSSEVIENGECILLFPGKLKCIYDNKDLKELIVNNNMLVVSHKRYEKNYFYPTSKSYFEEILVKQKLINLIKKSQESVEGKEIHFTYIKKNSQKIIMLFKKNNLELKGWIVSDQYNNNLEFLINILSENISPNIEIFKIPSIN